MLPLSFRRSLLRPREEKPTASKIMCSSTWVLVDGFVRWFDLDRQPEIGHSRQQAAAREGASKLAHSKDGSTWEIANSECWNSPPDDLEVRLVFREQHGSESEGRICNLDVVNEPGSFP